MPDGPRTESGLPFWDVVERCESPMQRIVERYGLQGKSVFSVGAGAAFEEYWLWRNGCALNLLDISEDISNYVSQLAPAHLDDEKSVSSSRRANGAVAATAERFRRWAAGGAGRKLTGWLAPIAERLRSRVVGKDPLASIRWIFEDAGEWVAKNPGPEFDILYVSSFHPDEIRREDIQADFKERRNSDEAYHHITWPRGEKPYHDMIVNAFGKVHDDGLIILQHYRGGVYVKENPHYLDDVVKQFSAHGVTLLEVYCFRQSTAHLLIAAYKGERKSALAFQRSLKSRPPINSFHGRYGDDSVRNDVVNVYALGDPSLLARFLAEPATT